MRTKTTEKELVLASVDRRRRDCVISENPSEVWDVFHDNTSVTRELHHVRAQLPARESALEHPTAQRHQLVAQCLVVRNLTLIVCNGKSGAGVLGPEARRLVNREEIHRSRPCHDASTHRGRRDLVEGDPASLTVRHCEQSADCHDRASQVAGDHTQVNRGTAVVTQTRATPQSFVHRAARRGDPHRKPPRLAITMCVAMVEVRRRPRNVKRTLSERVLQVDFLRSERSHRPLREQQVDGASGASRRLPDQVSDRTRRHLKQCRARFPAARRGCPECFARRERLETQG